MLGVLNVYKPVGPTSRDVVGRVHAALPRSHRVKKIKVGHAGTLDPLAEGVLGVCLGRATRLIEYLQDGRKEYRATFAFGVTSDSLDNETEPRPVGGSENVTETSLAVALPDFIGTIAQVPPAFSAVRIDGCRAFDLARQGRDVAPEPRPFIVDRFELDRLEPGEHGPVG
ncbi:MAG: tRNA pseudouridine(55) synthase, partial [Planctomycetota bacterium]